jgi:hypothetical protein
MLSPVFDVVPHSPWKHHVKSIWKFLSDNYRIAKCDEFYTRISLQLNPIYTLTELKRIASSIIHFETAIEPLQPENPNDPDNAPSIWLHSPPLARSCRSRSASIRYIDECSTWPELRNMINDPWFGGFGHYAWKFSGFNSTGFITFYKLPPYPRPPQLFSWAELTMAFILAAIRYGSPDYLRRCAHDVGSLKDFVGRVDIPGDGPHHLDRIWEGISLNAAREPMVRTSLTDIDGVEADPRDVRRYWMRLKEMIELDAEECAASVPQLLQNRLNGLSTSA